jgi:hypothetical protein
MTRRLRVWSTSDGRRRRLEHGLDDRRGRDGIRQADRAACNFHLRHDGDSVIAAHSRHASATQLRGAKRRAHGELERAETVRPMDQNEPPPLKSENFYFGEVAAGA